MLFVSSFRGNMMKNVWSTERKEIATWLSGYLGMVKKWVDRILDKINEHGFGSLDENEKKCLEKAKKIIGKK